MINNTTTWLSLLDVVRRMNTSNIHIPLCPSHNQFFSAIPAVIPFLSGFEYHLLSLSSPCDSLVCFLTRDLPKFSRLSSVDDCNTTHLFQAHRATELLLDLPDLLCLTDHIWFELDAIPNKSLSLFVGNHSNVQSKVERDSILTECKSLTHHWISSLSSNPIPIFDFNFALLSLFSDLPDWHIAEVGIMDRYSDKAHIKLLMNPPKSLSLKNFLDIYSEIFPNTSTPLTTFKSSTLFEILNNFDCHYQLSLALYKDKMIGAIEVLPNFDLSKLHQYDDLFCSILTSCSALLGTPDFNNKLDCETLFVEIGDLSFSSRMHHLKLYPDFTGVWVPKIYRDLRIVE